MYFLNFLIFILLAYETNAKFDCITTPRLKGIRKLFKVLIRNNKAVDIITSYATLSNYSQEPLEILKFTEMPASTQYLPPVLSEKHDNTYDLDSFPEKRKRFKVNLNFTSQYFYTHQSVIENAKCSDNGILVSKVLFFEYNISTIIKMQTCFLTKTPNTSIVVKEKRFLYMINSDHDRTNIAELLASGDYEQQDFKFDEFDEEGFCMCNFLDLYFEECMMQKAFEGKNINGFYVCLTFIGLILLCFFLSEVLTNFLSASQPLQQFLH